MTHSFISGLHFLSTLVQIDGQVSDGFDKKGELLQQENALCKLRTAIVLYQAGIQTGNRLYTEESNQIESWIRQNTCFQNHGNIFVHRDKSLIDWNAACYRFYQIRGEENIATRFEKTLLSSNRLSSYALLCLSKNRSLDLQPVFKRILQKEQDFPDLFDGLLFASVNRLEEYLHRFSLPPVEYMTSLMAGYMGILTGQESYIQRCLSFQELDIQSKFFGSFRLSDFDTTIRLDALLAGIQSENLLEFSL